MNLTRTLSILTLAIGLTVLPGTLAMAGRFDGTYEGKVRLRIGGEGTWVFARLVIDDKTARVTLFEFEDRVMGEQLDEFDAKAFLDNRGVFFGLLTKDDNIIAGFGGRINGRGDNGRVLGKVLQEDFRSPFVLKEVDPDEL